MNLIKVEPHYKPEVALEGIIDIADKSFSSMVGAISNFFPSLYNVFNGTIDAITNLKPLSSDILNSLVENHLASERSGFDLTSFNRVNVRVPEGFSGNLDDYAQFLQRSWNFLHTEAIPLMDTVYGQLASFASNKNSKLSLSDTSKLFVGAEATYEELVKESRIYFGKTRHQGIKSDIGTAYGDYGRFLSTENRIAVLAKQLSPKQVNQVLEKIKRIAGVLDVIIKDAQNHEYDKASYEAVKGMATGVYAMAQAMEFYSITYYRINEMAVVCKENKQVIKKLK